MRVPKTGQRQHYEASPSLKKNKTKTAHMSAMISDQANTQGIRFQADRQIPLKAAHAMKKTTYAACLSLLGKKPRNQ